MSIYRDPDCLDRVSASLGAIAGVCSVVTGAQPVAVSAGLLSMATGGISAWRGRLAQSNADASAVLEQYIRDHKNNWRKWSGLTESAAREPGEIESAITSFETYFNSEDQHCLPSADIIVAQGRNAQKISIKMLEHASEIYPSFYREYDQRGKKDQTTKFSREFFLLVVEGGLKHLLHLPEFAEILRPAMQDLAIETNMVVKENRQISNETLKGVREIQSGQDEIVKCIVASFSSQLESKDDQLDSKDLQIAELTKTVVALASAKNNPNVNEGIDAALQALSQGDTEKAELIFQAKVEEGEAESLKTAESYRHLGALAYFHDTVKAVNAYQRSTELDPDNTDGSNSLGHLLFRIGDLDGAISSYSRLLDVASKGMDPINSIAYGNLGNVYKTRGKLDKAEEYYLKSLAIDEALDYKEGVARAYGNLGNLYQTLSEQDKAKEFFLKSLAINKAIGNREGMASDYSALGTVYHANCELDKAEEFHLKSLTLHEALDLKEGMASDYGNLGSVYKARGELDKAEEYHLKSLAIEETLGRKEGMASDCVNLGNLYKARGELDKAEEYYLKFLAINEDLGSKEGLAGVYRTLGNVCQIRGELDKAEEY